MGLEVKFDGYRALAIKDGQKLALISRNAKVLTDRYGAVIEALKSLPAKQFVLDGEVVALDSEGSILVPTTAILPNRRAR